MNRIPVAHVQAGRHALKSYIILKWALASFCYWTDRGAFMSHCWLQSAYILTAATSVGSHLWPQNLRFFFYYFFNKQLSSFNDLKIKIKFQQGSIFIGHFCVRQIAIIINCMYNNKLSKIKQLDITRVCVLDIASHPGRVGGRGGGGQALRSVAEGSQCSCSKKNPG